MPEDFSGFENVWLRSSFEAHCLTGSYSRNTRRFENQVGLLVDTLNDCDYDLLGRQPKIPRLMGMRHASREWTVFMVVEHLCLHTDYLFRAMQALLIGDETRALVPNYRYLVPEDVGADCIDRFQDSAWQYIGFANNLAESGRYKESTGSIRHDLFGRLGLKRLHALSSFHIKIHRRQVQKVLATEGVV
ncbi:hypothetical protein [Mariniblastus fucicola]|uniref:DinB superfamily protein n=1 Tax=Mariniblastus fucicola TaxID=980251 RepID=A0A5B9PD69_9BACT|nr:hypothetical protein [Mariniblastus fucicola]QEG22516.1 hypothetical protein MFFC18_23970 [Mariniblastus fucicola]